MSVLYKQLRKWFEWAELLLVFFSFGCKVNSHWTAFDAESESRHEFDGKNVLENLSILRCVFFYETCAHFYFRDVYFDLISCTQELIIVKFNDTTIKSNEFDGKKHTRPIH